MKMWNRMLKIHQESQRIILFICKFQKYFMEGGQRTFTFLFYTVPHPYNKKKQSNQRVSDSIAF